MLDRRFWDDVQKRWDGHTAFNTVSHYHVSCYSPAPGHPNCEVSVVECDDGRWYVEDSWGSDAPGAENVWNPCDHDAKEPHFFGSQAEATAHAVVVVASVSGVPKNRVSSI